MILKINNIEVKYHEVILVIKGVSIEVPDGGIVALLGANGAGKSTILKTVMGLIDDQPDKGTIEFMGKRIDGMDTDRIVRMGITLVPEGREVFEELTIRENLLMGAYIRKDKKGIDDDFDRVFEYFPILKERVNQWAGTLSGGEQQMLAMGRALMIGQKLVLLDEPSMGLAPFLVKDIMKVVKRLNEEGITILLVEQNAKMALGVADYGYVVETGEIVMHDEAEVLKNDERIINAYLGE